jgi:hypothetical protein
MVQQLSFVALVIDMKPWQMACPAAIMVPTSKVNLFILKRSPCQHRQPFFKNIGRYLTPYARLKIAGQFFYTISDGLVDIQPAMNTIGTKTENRKAI